VTGCDGSGADGATSASAFDEDCTGGRRFVRLEPGQSFSGGGSSSSSSSSSGGGGKAKTIVIACNTHLFSHNAGDAVRLLQTWIVLHQLGEFIRNTSRDHPNVGVVLCVGGDFNSDPLSGAVKLMQNGQCCLDCSGDLMRSCSLQPPPPPSPSPSPAPAAGGGGGGFGDGEKTNSAERIASGSPAEEVAESM
jgi:hypothetical protein